MSFAEITRRTKCPFAVPSRLGPGITVTTSDVESDLRARRETIATFFRDAAERELDGMVITFEDPALGATIEALTLLTRRLITLLDELFVGVYVPPEPRTDQQWYAMIEGERFFIVSFAPCYPADSPRHTYGDTRTHVLLQPASTFVRRAEAVERLRPRIQRAFAAAGKPYDTELANVDNDLFKHVMPLRPTDDPVRWWAHDDRAATSGK